MRIGTLGIAVLAINILNLVLAPQILMAQEEKPSIEELRLKGQQEGWTFTVGETSVSHIPLEQLTGFVPPPKWAVPENGDYSLLEAPPGGWEALPASYDYRAPANGGITPVKNQSSCGSCWSFAICGVFEALIKAVDGVEVDLSEQWLIDCNTDGWGCNGGFWAHDYFYNKPGSDGRYGAVLESEKPYTVSDGTCGGPYHHPYLISGAGYVDGAGVPATNLMKQAILDHGPLLVAVTTSAAFQSYTGGVFNAHDPTYPTDHAVVIVGWDDNAGNGAWIMRNSWGTGWGESGYMRIEYGTSSIGDYAMYLTYAGGSGSDKAFMTAPANSGDTLDGASHLFTWSTGINVTEFQLAIGTGGAGSTDIYNQSVGSAQSQLIGSLPTDGSTVYVRLSSRISGAWQHNDYTYVAADTGGGGGGGTAAAMTSPANSGDTLDGASHTFQWDTGTNVTSYDLWAATGSISGASDPDIVYKSGPTASQSATATSLPTDGSTVYVQLRSQIDGSWQYRNYTYVAATSGGGGDTDTPAAMTDPANNGDTLDGSSHTFQWDTGTGVDSYNLWVGTGTMSTPTDTDIIYKSGPISSLSHTVNNLPTSGATLHARLFSLIDGSWESRDYTYTAATDGGGDEDATIAQMTDPASDGATLDGATQTFTWSAGTGIQRYNLWVGTAAMTSPSDTDIIYKSGPLDTTSNTVSSLPTDGSTVHVRLFSYDGSTWQSNDYTYTAASGGGGDDDASIAQMTDPASDGATLDGATQTFTWSAGTGVERYNLWVGTAAMTSPSDTDIIYKSGPLDTTSDTVSGLPTNGSTVHVRLFSYDGSTWQSNDYTYTAASGGGGDDDATIAQMTNPASDGATLDGASQTFTWSAGTGVERYNLWVGTAAMTTPSDTDIIHKSGPLDTTSTTVTNLPTDGSSIYVRLFSYDGSTWQSNDYTYTAASGGGDPPSAAEMTDPASNGGTLSGANHTFTWSTGTAVERYNLWVGTDTMTGPDDPDILHKCGATNDRSAACSGLPTDGSTVHVRLWSYINGSWTSRDYTYLAATVTTPVAPADDTTEPEEATPEDVEEEETAEIEQDNESASDETNEQVDGYSDEPPLDYLEDELGLPITGPGCAAGVTGFLPLAACLFLRTMRTRRRRR